MDRERGGRRGGGSTSLNLKVSARRRLLSCSPKLTATSAGRWRPSPSPSVSGPSAASTEPWQTADSTSTSSRHPSQANKRRRRWTESRRWCTETSRPSASRSLPIAPRPQREGGGEPTAPPYSPHWWWEGRTTTWPRRRWGSAQTRELACSSTDFIIQQGEFGRFFQKFSTKHSPVWFSVIYTNCTMLELHIKQGLKLLCECICSSFFCDVTSKPSHFFLFMFSFLEVSDAAAPGNTPSPHGLPCPLRPPRLHPLPPRPPPPPAPPLPPRTRTKTTRKRTTWWLARWSRARRRGAGCPSRTRCSGSSVTCATPGTT